MPSSRRTGSPARSTPRPKRAPADDAAGRHHDYIAIERDADQEVHVTIGQPTAGGREVDGGFSQLFNRVMSSGIYAALPLPARAVYTALVFLADNGRFFIVDGQRGPGATAGTGAPGVNLDRIMQVSGCGETAVKSAMKTLADRQLIRVLRKGGSKRNGRRVASIYQLLLPVAGYEQAHLPDHEATPYGGALRTGAVAPHDPVPGRPAPGKSRATHPHTGSPRADFTRNTKTEERPITPAEELAERIEAGDVAAEDARGWLLERGVSELMVGRAVESVEPANIARQVLDFDLRNRQPGRPKTPGWLAKAVLVGYDLHATTQTFLDRTAQRAKAAARQRQHDAEQDAEAARQAKIDAWVNEELAVADDEELAEWHRKVMAQYPQLTRGLASADPRKHPRLRALIGGLLASCWPGE